MDCIIIDDQVIDSDYLKAICLECGFEVKAIFDKPIEAIDFITNNKIEVVFLDIDMPGISGLEFAKLLPSNSLIVFVSSHKKYAVNAYDIDAIDFISKPVSTHRLIQTYNKIKLSGNKNSILTPIVQQEGFPDFIILKIDGVYKKFFFNEINFIEALSNFVKIHTANKINISYGTASFFEENLPKHLFIRVHRQYLINLSKITSFSTQEVTLEGVTIPIGNAYRDDFMQQVLKSGYLKTR